jgi:hypothetical protein
MIRLLDSVSVPRRNGVVYADTATKEASVKSLPGHLAYATLDVRPSFLWQAKDDIAATSWRSSPTHCRQAKLRGAGPEVSCLWRLRVSRPLLH